MSETREYYSRSEEHGDVFIAEEVLEMIAGAAALEVDGVSGLTGATAAEQFLGRKKLSKGISILWESDNITIDVSIQIKYGVIVPEVAKKVQEAIIANVEGWGQGAKYSTFAGADNPLTVFTNPEVTDGSVCIVVKESYGNAFMPYIVDHYSTVYEIDYRYWKGNLVDFARQVGATDIIFANNIGMVRSSYLVGLLDKIVP